MVNFKRSFFLTALSTALIFCACEIKIVRKEKEKVNGSKTVKHEVKNITDPTLLSIQNLTIPPEVGKLSEDLQSIHWYANGKIYTSPIPFESKSYKLNLLANGTEAYKVYPTIQVFIDEKKIGEAMLSDSIKTYQFELDGAGVKTGVINFRFEQDGRDEEGHDRDIIIHSINLKAL